MPDESISFEIDAFTEEFKIEAIEEIKEIEVIEVKEAEQELEVEIMEEMEQEIEEIKEPEETKEETKPEPIKPKEIKQKIANKLMAKGDKMSAQSQTTQLALMVILSDINFESYTQRQIKDGVFYKEVSLREQNVIIDYQAGILGYMDYGMMNEMVDSQWE